jgi:hypothetical protein
MSRPRSNFSCTVTSCERRALGPGTKLCKGHWQQASRGRILGLFRVPIRFCSTDGCNRPHHARGLCAAHYQQQAKGRKLTPIKGPHDPRLPPTVATRNRILQGIRTRASGKKMSFSLTDEQMVKLMMSPCYWCGIRNGNPGRHKVTERQSGAWPHNGIDRLDSNLGYFPSNVVASCGQCNRAKLDSTPEDFLSMCRRVVSIHGFTDGIDD